tara:strand:- start:6629 stop:7483 length:855 start_codon:yes stop_codon:yes gene_type:complete
MKNYKIGIVGKGFVGSAVQNGFSANTGCEAEVRIYDKDPGRSLNTLEEVMQCDFVFLSVPTPSNLDGSMNLDFIHAALKEMSEHNSKDAIVLVRSTIVPGTSSALQEKYSSLKIVFNPEFLTERSAHFDFINQSRIILGGEKNLTSKVADLYSWRFGTHIPIIQTDFQTAELIKYMNNCFFATKVSFLNEMKLLADKTNCDWDTAVEGFVLDGRVGHSHLQVPGPDGKMGFGGSCFPKDIQAIIHFGVSMGLSMQTLKGAWETNIEVRPEKDWEKLLGRALVEN